MYNLLAVVIGMLVTIMSTLSSGFMGKVGAPYEAIGLSANLGNGNALVIFHLIGAILALLTLIILKKKLVFKSSLPIYFYMGGMIGYCMVFINAVSIGKLGASLTFAVVIFGQMAMSAVIDHYGLFGKSVTKFNTKKIGGFLIIFIGLCLMVYGS